MLAPRLRLLYLISACETEWSRSAEYFFGWGVIFRMLLIGKTIVNFLMAVFRVHRLHHSLELLATTEGFSGRSDIRKDTRQELCFKKNAGLVPGDRQNRLR